MRGVGTLGGSLLRPVIIGVSRSCPLIKRVDRDRRKVQRDCGQQRVPENPMQRCDRVCDGCRRQFRQWSLVGDVVGDVEPAQRLAGEQTEQQQHHPAAGGVVAGRAIGLAAERVGQMVHGHWWRPEKAGKPRRVAAEESPK
jgi:hypothetical protein